MAQGEISVSNQCSVCSPHWKAEAPPQSHQVSSAERLWDNPIRAVWKLSLFLPSWSNVHACVSLGPKTNLCSRRKLRCCFPSWEARKVLEHSCHVSWSWLSLQSTHTRGVEAGDVCTSPCPVHHVTRAFLQKKMILSPCVELSLSSGRAAGSLPAVWVGRFGLGVCVPPQSPLFPSCSGLCVNFSQNPLWELLVETVSPPLKHEDELVNKANSVS